MNIFLYFLFFFCTFVHLLQRIFSPIERVEGRGRQRNSDVKETHGLLPPVSTLMGPGVQPAPEVPALDPVEAVTLGSVGLTP